MSNPDPVQSSPTTVFILLRHVNNELTNQYWQLACQRIHKFYPSALIYIIDDHSRTEWLTPVPDELAAQVTVINSELPPGRGEILPLYYFHLNRWADSAVIIHDSVFLQSPLLDKINSKEPVQYIWSFKHPHLYDNREIEKAQLARLNYADELSAIYRNTKSWVGCFGCMTYITWDYLSHINDKYGLFSLVDYISTKPDRCSLERTFAIVCHHDRNHHIDKTVNCTATPVNSMYGTIYEYGRRYLNNLHFGLTYPKYQSLTIKPASKPTQKPVKTNSKRQQLPIANCANFHNAPIIKVWSGR